MWKPEILGILLISLAVSTVNSLYFHIAETERKCFIEEIPDDTTVIGMLINIFDNIFFDIILLVTLAVQYNKKNDDFK